SNQTTEGGACLLTAVQDSLRRAGCSNGSISGPSTSRVRNPLIGHLLEQRLEFVPSPGNWDAKVLEKLKQLGATILTTAAVPAVPPAQLLSSKDCQAVSEAPKKLAQPVQKSDAKKPQFSFASVQLDRPYHGQPCGFANEGNYCYMISVLQALIHTAPFVNFACEHRTVSACRQVDNRGLFNQHGQRQHPGHQQRQHQPARWCAVCELAAYAQRPSGSGAVYPRAFMARVTTVSPTLRPNRQEDAHEFMRCLLDYMERNCGGDKRRSAGSPAGPIRVLFGGRLKSSVLCTRCGTESRTFEDFMDLSLCIQYSSSLADCLRKFVSPDLLKDSNAYKCEKCRTKVTAKKSFSIASGPPILTVQLNRFQWGHSNKISRFVQFPLSIDLRPYMSKPGRPVHYELYALVIHQGSSTKFGHYYCYAKRGNAWWSLNDSCVDRINESRVLQSCPYILLYKRTDLSPLIESSTVASAAASSNLSVGDANSLSSPVAMATGGVTKSQSLVKPKLESANSVAMATGNDSFSPKRAKYDLTPSNSVAMVTGNGPSGLSQTKKHQTSSLVAMVTGNGPVGLSQAKHKQAPSNSVAMVTGNGPVGLSQAKHKQAPSNSLAMVTGNGPVGLSQAKHKQAPSNSVAMVTGNGPQSLSSTMSQPKLSNGPQSQAHAKPRSGSANAVAMVTGNGPLSPGHTKPKPTSAAETTVNGPLSLSSSKPQPIQQLAHGTKVAMAAAAAGCQQMRNKPNKELRQLMSASPRRPDPLPWSANSSPQKSESLIPNGVSINGRKRKVSDSQSSASSSLCDQLSAQNQSELDNKKRKKKEAKRKLKLLKLQQSSGSAASLVNGIDSVVCNGHVD
ncbi:hypothetical protein BOX15_Mlig028393g1, partial [Macrostomum lignano]